MKADLLIAFEAATWPALLVDATGVISSANPAALKFFGPPLESKSPALSALWRPESKVTAEQFLAVAEKVPVSPGGLKFAKADGSVVPLTASVCPITNEGQKYFLIQLLPEIAERQVAAADAGLAHKQ